MIFNYQFYDFFGTLNISCRQMESINFRAINQKIIFFSYAHIANTSLATVYSLKFYLYFITYFTFLFRWKNNISSRLVDVFSSFYQCFFFGEPNHYIHRLDNTHSCEGREMEYDKTASHLTKWPPLRQPHSESLKAKWGCHSKKSAK